MGKALARPQKGPHGSVPAGRPPEERRRPSVDREGRTEEEQGI